MRGIATTIEAVRPGTMTELLDLLAERPKARPIAGGTDIMVRYEAGGIENENFIDLTGLRSELRTLRLDAQALSIGPLTTFWDVRRDAGAIAAFPLLEQVARTIGAVQIQGRGTWAGNIGNGSPAADGVAALLVYDAEIVLESRGGRRTVPVNGFFTGYKVMDLRPGEFIREIRIPRREGDRRQAFHKVGTRLAQAITKVGLAVVQRGDGSWRVAGVSLAPFVTRYAGIEAVLNGGGAIRREELRQAIDAEVKPIDDLRSTAAYRKKVFRALLESELTEAGVDLRD